jgi:hypothetical protein
MRRLWEIWQGLMAVLLVPAIVVMLALIVWAPIEGHWSVVIFASLLVAIAGREAFVYLRRHFANRHANPS